MIGKLKGIVDSISETSAILDVGGVGYFVFCSGQTLKHLPPVGEAATLLIETHVREDHIHLYGFASEEERYWFKVLMTVSGVGAKIALAILSALKPEQLAIALAARDKAAFKAISGVGPKLAERLITELKDKVAEGTALIETRKFSNEIARKTGDSKTESAMADAISALISLGYNRSEAYMAIQKIAQEHKEAPVQEWIKAGLKELVS